MTQPTQSDSLDPRTECDFKGYHLMNGPICDICGFEDKKFTTGDPMFDILCDVMDWGSSNTRKGISPERAQEKIKALYAPNPDDDVEDILEKMYSEAYQCGVGAKHPDAYRPIKVVVSNTLAKLAAHYAAKEQEAVLRARIEERWNEHDAEFNYEPGDACPYCLGEAHSLKHEAITDHIADLTNQLNQLKGEK